VLGDQPGELRPYRRHRLELRSGHHRKGGVHHRLGVPRATPPEHRCQSDQIARPHIPDRRLSPGVGLHEEANQPGPDERDPRSIAGTEHEVTGGDVSLGGSVADHRRKHCRYIILYLTVHNDE
jgi:hypothetical protein